MRFDNDDGTDGYPYPPPRGRSNFRGPIEAPLRWSKPILVTAVVLILLYLLRGG